MCELWVKLTLQVYEFSIYYQFPLSRELVIILLPEFVQANVLVLFSMIFLFLYVWQEVYWLCLYYV